MTTFKRISALLSTLITGFMTWTLIGRIILPYNESGRYFDEMQGVVYDEGAIIFYSLLTLLFFVLSLSLWLWSRKNLHDHS